MKRVGISRWLQFAALVVLGTFGVVTLVWSANGRGGSAQVGPTPTLTISGLSTRQARVQPTASADHRAVLRDVIDKQVSVSDFPRSQVPFTSVSPDHVSFTDAARLASAVVIGRVEQQRVVPAKSLVQGLEEAYLLSDLRAADGTVYQIIEPIGVSRDTNGVVTLGYSTCSVPLEANADYTILVTPSSSVPGALEVILGNAYKSTASGAAGTCTGDPTIAALTGKSATDIKGLVTAQKLSSP